MVSKVMTILGVETTCDETGVGIVCDGREVLANVVSSSASLHKKYKGVVPEIAAREQVKVLIPAISEAISTSGVELINIDAIAVAYGPGLVGSLLVGVETAKTLALVLKKPLIPINHLIGHVYANWLTVIGSPSDAQALAGRRFTGEYGEPITVNREPEFPLVALIASGGHTDLILMTDHGKFKWLGGTRDDAAGEVFDKVARVLGLGYPGGPEIERVARQFTVDGSQLMVKFPRPMINEDNYDFSFSGLKTAVVNSVNGSQLTVHGLPEIAFEFQKAICDVLVTKTIKAAKKFGAKSIVVGGGVAASSFLRSLFSVHGSRLGLPIFFPSKELSVDNGAMIAAAAFYNQKIVGPLRLQANPSLYFKKIVNLTSVEI